MCHLLICRILQLFRPYFLPASKNKECGLKTKDSPENASQGRLFMASGNSGYHSVRSTFAVSNSSTHAYASVRAEATHASENKILAGLNS